MSSKPPFLKIHLRAMAQATEAEERVGHAMFFATEFKDISATRTKGHFGNPITIFEAELSKSGDMRSLLKKLDEAGILAQIIEQVEQRLDEDCVLHFRLDKQKAYAEVLALADSRDIIDVGMKVAAYPARREIALEAILDWIEGL
jgi:RNA binding exosome subunit